MSAVAYAVEVDYCTTEAGLGERGLWCAALSLLLEDCRLYYKTGNDRIDAIRGTGYRELTDVLGQGKILRRLCLMADVDPAYVSERFAKSL